MTVDVSIGDYVRIDVLSRLTHTYCVTAIEDETVMLYGGISELRVHESRISHNITVEMFLRIIDMDSL